MKKQIKQVQAFSDVFGVPYRTRPGGIEIKAQKQRIYLLEEEIQELDDAIRANDIVEIADAIVDIAYVLCGGVLEFGLQKKFVEYGRVFANFDRYTPEQIKSAILKGFRAQIEALHYYAETGKFSGIIDVLNAQQDWVYFSLDFYDLSPIFEDLFDEVHRTNMAKLHDGKVVKDPMTAKVQKPADWQPPNLKKIIETYFINNQNKSK
jgi:predicted HAD superfamily Cof-like phosphohydrolase